MMRGIACLGLAFMFACGDDVGRFVGEWTFDTGTALTACGDNSTVGPINLSTLTITIARAQTPHDIDVTGLPPPDGQCSVATLGVIDHNARLNKRQVCGNTAVDSVNLGVSDDGKLTLSSSIAVANSAGVACSHSVYGATLVK